MAHSDALIFLTNITWIFFLFLFIYFFFVVFFLPTFYKKFRARVLIKSTNYLGGLLASRNVLVTLTFFVEVFRNFSISVTRLVKKYSNSLKNNFLTLIVKEGSSLDTLVVSFLDAFGASNKYKLNLTVTVSSLDGAVVFTKYNKL